MRGAVAASVALLALAAGCGGSSDETSATETWANGVCSALQTWTDSVQSTASTLQDPSSLSADSVTAALNDVIDATSTLASDVKSLGPPETESGQQAQETLNQLAGTLEDDAGTLQDLLDSGGGSGINGLLDQISAVTKTLSSMASAVTQAFEDLQNLDAKGELQDAFENADSCDSLTSGS